MPYTAPPAKNEISATPSPDNDTAKAGFGKLWEMVTNLLGGVAGGGKPAAAYAAMKLLDPQAIYNLRVSFTLPGGNVLRATLTDKDGNALGANNPGQIAMRSSVADSGAFNLRNQEANIQLDVVSGATLGHVSGLAANLFWYLIEKDAATWKLAVCGTYLGLSGRFTTVLLDVNADQDNVLYADEALADKPGRLIGVSLDTQAAAGVWAALPSAVTSGSFDPTEYVATPIVPGGRLTLENGVPVSTADQAGAATVYYTPYLHNQVQLYDGTKWKWHVFAQMSQATNDAAKSPAAVAASKNYDVFVWNDAGTLRATRGPTWDAGAVAGSDTARGTGAGSTELEFFQGRYVNKNAIANGPAARRGLYVGTIRSDGASQINDTLAKRHVWNCYSRVERQLRVLEATNSWTYTTSAWRQANNSAANQLDVLIGLSEDLVSVEAVGQFSNSAGPSTSVVSVGLDSASVPATVVLGRQSSGGANIPAACTALYRGLPGIGRHYFTWMENGLGGGGGTVTWFGDNNAPDLQQTGIQGEIRA